jgi:hypothetical protein
VTSPDGWVPTFWRHLLRSVCSCEAIPGVTLLQIQNYYVAAGMKTIGISAAGGVGRATAELIVSGSSSYDMYELDISRFLGLHNNRKFLRDRVREVPGKYAFVYTFRDEITSGFCQCVMYREFAYPHLSTPCCQTFPLSPCLFAMFYPPTSRSS